MTSLIDLVGKRFGRLVVLRRDYRVGRPYWVCRCDCGAEKAVAGHNLTTSNIKSCGCLRKEGQSNPKHGASRLKLYKVWGGMRARCSNPKLRCYPHYGGRGIRVCDAWQEWSVFAAWAGASGYREGLTIERRDPNGDYCPENCEWIPLREQPRNTRVVLKAPDGRLWWEIAAAQGVNRKTFMSRVRAGWALDVAAPKPAARAAIAKATGQDAQASLNHIHEAGRGE